MRPGSGCRSWGASSPSTSSRYHDPRTTLWGWPGQNGYRASGRDGTLIRGASQPVPRCHSWDGAAAPSDTSLRGHLAVQRYDVFGSGPSIANIHGVRTRTRVRLPGVGGGDGDDPVPVIEQLVVSGGPRCGRSNLKTDLANPKTGGGALANITVQKQIERSRNWAESAFNIASPKDGAPVLGAEWQSTAWTYQFVAQSLFNGRDPMTSHWSSTLSTTSFGTIRTQSSLWLLTSVMNNAFLPPPLERTSTTGWDVHQSPTFKR